MVSSVIAPLPEVLARLLTERKPTTKRELPAAGEPIPEGQRNQRLFALGCAIRRHGASDLEIASALMFTNHHRCRPPLPDAELQSIIESASKYEALTVNPKAASKAGPKVWTAAELLATDFPEPRWCVPDLIPEGLTVLAGREKRGKSWLALSLCLATAAGGKALSQFDVPQGEALYCALEDPPRRVKDRLQRLLADGEAPPDGLHILHSLPMLDAGGLDWLDGWLTEHPQARLVIIDIWARVRPARKRDADLYQFDVQQAALLQALAVKHGIALVMIHHLRKAESEDPLDLISGSTGLAGTADCLLVLRRAPRENSATLYCRGRDIEEQELALEFDSGLWTFEGDAAEVKRSEERQAVLRVLAEAGKPMTSAEVALTLDWSKDRARVLMWRMAAAGDLRSLGKATYRLPETTETIETTETGETLKRFSVSGVSGGPDTARLL